jgi:RNA polymerase sigma factor (sigma-70 family)
LTASAEGSAGEQPNVESRLAGSIPSVERAMAGREFSGRNGERGLDRLDQRYQELGPMVLSYVRRLVPDGHAEDVLQQTFLDAWRHRDDFDETRPLEPWLLAIARRRSIDLLRRHYRNAQNGEAVARQVRAPDPVTFAASWAEAADVRQALSQLSPNQREPLVLAYFGGLTQSEIATRLGEPLGTIKARMARGMHRLAAILVEGEEQ